MSPLSSFLLAAGLVMQASATTIRVDVGKTGLTFDPNVITAGVGDVLEFHFYPRNHSVVSGLWTQACIPPASGGFYTGFFPTANNTVNSQVFRVTINDTDPHVFYCSQNTGAHCRNGMVGVVNPFGSNTLEFYVGLARGALTAVSPPSAFGGTIAQANASASTTSASGGSGASSSTSSAASESGTGSASSGSITGTGTGTGTASATSTATTSSSSTSQTATSGSGSLGTSFAGLVAVGAAALALV